MQMTGGQEQVIGRVHSGMGWGRAGVWCMRGWRIFRLAPVRIFLLALVPVVAEGLIQLAPGMGVAVSKILTPVVGAWVLLMLDHKVRDALFGPGMAVREVGLRWNRVAVIALVSLAVFGFQVLVAAIVGNQEQAVAFATGDIAGIAYSRAELAGILTSGLLPMLLLFFVVPRMLLDGLSLRPAFVENARLLMHYWRPIALYTLGSALLMASLLWVPVMLLVLLPAGLCVGYGAYRDVFDLKQEP